MGKSTKIELLSLTLICVSLFFTGVKGDISYLYLGASISVSFFIIAFLIRVYEKQESKEKGAANAPAPSP